MKTLMAVLMLLLLPALALAAEQGALEKVDIDVADKPALQDGARTFVNYCMGCHSARFQRYERVADDLGIPHDLMLEKLVFTGAKIGDHMSIGMQSADAKAWFGAAPPDLTLVARVRGIDWLYGYLRGFYADPSRPWGVNNTVFPNVGMPDVLAGVRQSLAPEQFDEKIKNLVTFLAYSANPVKLQSQRIGTYVLLYLAVFFIFAYLLKREYWKDVH
ncbi:cytochrome c1 [Pseudomonas sp. UBA4194]|uniref:cytochrome c1 n=1 Tax=Pseudomonas sp. UBA4194 TaxID=1947317 RepID=UPI0025F73A3D|nr:cytochrome c1 [Pseudomonas sp. UBA4194]